MAELQAPIFSETFQTVDGVVLNDKSAQYQNGYIDELGGVNVRPGLKSLYSSGSLGAILALHYLPSVDKLFFIQRASSGVIGSGIATWSGTAWVSTPVTTGHSLIANQRCSVVFDGTRILAANGGAINYFDISTGVGAPITDTDAPTSVTHIDFLDQYVLANNNDGKFWWSDVANSLSWNALSFATAGGHPDSIIALKVVNREIYLIGSRSVEIWENDGATPFSRVPGGYVEIGCSAPYSVINIDGALIWLSDRRTFVQFDGRNPVKISSPFDKVISDMTLVSDCIADRLDVSGRTYCCFSFPSAGRSLVYDFYNKTWQDWTEFVAASNLDLVVNHFCATYDSTRGHTLVGGSRNEKIFKLDPDYRFDDSSDTPPVRFSRTSGHISYGTLKRKRSNRLSFRAKRGNGGSSSPKLMLQWRNDNSSQWSSVKELNLGNDGDFTSILRLHRTGIFRTRQYKLSCTDNVPIVLAEAFEDVEILTS